MSAYIVDPRTVDYLVKWATRHRGDHSMGPFVLLTPEEYDAWNAEGNGHLLHGNRDYCRVYLAQLPEDMTGGILMRQNIRSVRARYPEDSADDLPGPIDQRGVFQYRYRPFCADVRPLWVYQSVRCWEYQSCETEDHEGTLAWRMAEAIKDDAASAAAEDDNAPWGVTDRDMETKKIA